MQKKTTGIFKIRVLRSLDSKEKTCKAGESNTFQQDLVDWCWFKLPESDPEQRIFDIFKQSPTLEESALVTIIATK